MVEPEGIQQREGIWEAVPVEGIDCQRAEAEEVASGSELDLNCN